MSQVFFCSEGTHHDYISYYSGLVLCNTSIFLCVCFFRARFMLSLRDRFCFFSISNSTLLFEQSSHFLTLTVLCRQTKPVNFCWFRFFLSHFLCWTDELLLFVIQLCVFSVVVVFLLPSCSLVLFYFFAHYYYTSMLNIVFSLFVFFIIIFLLLLSVDFNQDLLCWTC